MKDIHVRFSWNPIHPQRDWRWLITASVTLLAIIVAWSAYLYITSGKIDEPEEMVPVEQGNSVSARLDAITSYFEER